MSTSYLLSRQMVMISITHRSHQQQSMTPTSLALSCTHTANNALQPSLAYVSLTQLDCPPDHHPPCHPNHIPPQLTLVPQYPPCNDTPFTKAQYGAPSTHASMFPALQPIPLFPNSANIWTSAASLAGTHDLQPP